MLQKQKDYEEKLVLLSDFAVAVLEINYDLNIEN